MAKNRSRRRILSAFRELLVSYNYGEILVTAIIDKAEVSKSTFYRYYSCKLDVFVEMHSDIFDRLLVGLVTEDDWLSQNPHHSIISMSMLAIQRTGGRRSLAAQFGDEWSNAVRLLKISLAGKIKGKINTAFSEDHWHISLDVLSHSLSVLYIEYLIQLINTPSLDVAKKNAYALQAFSCALIKTALQR
ncbi:TetR/AcrR family transcriptional regulator [Photobacterium kishitanii]|uniref:TetR/AcrR family transcriptional regulator n=1 Tax=Photobacterium kishitanii TaxID=318456 RepID=UPI0005D3ABB8|nr:TetR/AcrR family transcriptional regulator [Photobacterium kishitanii]KJG08610.1 hypothetical protein UB40_17275 [Photobacterium kishitanii]PSV04972.1 TetR/AcrR family transcriptional regulator [Photobacterium kishitanii]PSV74344.1 TetR/AcrR family transcriptional regulator [Photobacterium kishitanii]